MQNLPYELLEIILNYTHRMHHLDIMMTTKIFYFFRYLLRYTIIDKEQTVYAQFEQQPDHCFIGLNLIFPEQNPGLPNQSRIMCHTLPRSLVRLSLTVNEVNYDFRQLPRLKVTKFVSNCLSSDKFNKLDELHVISPSITHINVPKITHIIVRKLTVDNTIQLPKNLKILRYQYVAISPLILPEGLIYLETYGYRDDKKNILPPLPSTLETLVLKTHISNLQILPSSLKKLSLEEWLYDNYDFLYHSNVTVLRCDTITDHHKLPIFEKCIYVTTLILNNYAPNIIKMMISFPPFLRKFSIFGNYEIDLQPLPISVISLRLFMIKNETLNIPNTLQYLDFIHCGVKSTNCFQNTLKSLLILSDESSIYQLPISLIKLSITYDPKLNLDTLINLRYLFIERLLTCRYNFKELKELRCLKIKGKSDEPCIIEFPPQIVYFNINRKMIWYDVPKSLQYVSIPMDCDLPPKRPKYLIIQKN